MRSIARGLTDFDGKEWLEVVNPTRAKDLDALRILPGPPAGLERLSRKHIYQKSGFDFTVLDLTGATSRQIDTVFSAHDKWRADPKMKPLNTLMILGEDY